jgi:phage baseplate assembly protein W
MMDLANSLLEETVLGKGLKSPLQEDPATGDFARISGAENVKQCIKDLLATSIGERLMNEDAGADLQDLLFSDPDAVVDLAPRRVADAIRRYETRVKDVRVGAERVGDRQVDVEVSWTLRSTGTRDSLVYPFYVEPPQGGVSINE